MTAYATIHPPTRLQQVKEAREKRRAILEAVRKRRSTIYKQYHQRLKKQGLSEEC